MPPNSGNNSSHNSSSGNASSGNNSNKLDTSPAFWELNFAENGGSSVDANGSNSKAKSNNNKDNDEEALNAWLQAHVTQAAAAAQITEPAAHNILWRNLMGAVRALRVVEQPEKKPDDDDYEDEDDDEDDDDDGNRRKKKRRKRTIQRRYLQDPYKIWFQQAGETTADDVDSNNNDDDTINNNNGLIEWDEQQEDIPDTDGGKLAVLSVGGLLNGLAHKTVSPTPHAGNPKALFKRAVASGVAQQLARDVFAGCNNSQQVTVLTLHATAVSLHRALARQVQDDILRTTPRRIQALLAGELTAAEFASIRKRVYDTVVLGRGTHVDDAVDEEDLPTVANAGLAVHDIEKYKKCATCGNNEQADFVLDRKNGDVICSHCGTVVSESIMHEGSQFRKFEGEVDRNHHGDAANPLLSNAHNMGTSLSGVVPTAGAGVGGWGAQSTATGNKRNLETILKNAHAYTELNVSQFGRTDRRTRIGYKDRQKKDAFITLTHAGDNLNLHEAVVRRAKEIFAGFRDDRELVQQFKGVLAACLCEAFEQLSAEGKHLTRQQQQQADQQEQQRQNGGDVNDDGTAQPLSARAARRNEMHHTTLAGKGGLLLNKANLAMKEPDDEGKKPAGTITDDQGREKPVASWDLEDCRSWLLEASRSIAQAWDAERQTNSGSALARKIPAVPLGDLEGRLVGQSFTLCEHLEAELQSRGGGGGGNSRGGRAVTTPRVTDMSKLGIKWQHSHERGSGGHGGVGGSGRTGNGVGGSNGRRTAGQILLMKTAKKLGVVLQDPLAGEAFHRELAAVKGRQEAIKQKRMREEATRQRFNQMKRKPWLQARLQQES